MNLKLGQKLLVIGAGLLGIGIILVVVTFIMIGQSSYSFSTATQPISVRGHSMIQFRESLVWI